MSRRIFKYPLSLTPVQRIEIPRGATFLAAQIQRDDLCVWYIVDDEQTRRVTIEIAIVGTGHELPAGRDRSNYLGTVQTSGGAFVWHLFQTARRE